MTDVLWYQRGDLWSELCLDEVTLSDLNENKSVKPPYPEPTESRTMAYLTGWNKFEFMRSANYYMVNDRDLPLSVFPYLLEKKNKSKLITFVRDRLMRTTLADFIAEASWPITESNLKVFYKFGHVALIDYARQGWNLPYFKSEIKLNVQYGHLSRLIDVVTYFRDTDGRDTDGRVKTIYTNGIYGQEVECTYFRIIYPTFPLDENTFYIAAKYGSLTCLQYMHKQMVDQGVECSWDGYTIHAAATHGHVDCLQYAWDNQCPNIIDNNYKRLIYATTAQNGHLACLKFLNEHGYNNGYDYNTETLLDLPLPSAFIGVCENGHLDCLKYLVENNVKNNNLQFINTHVIDECIRVATKAGHLDCVQYIQSRLGIR
jgi:hypothetical protein